MKKVISLLLVIAMLLTCFVACGEKTGTGQNNGGSSGDNSSTDAKVGDVLDVPEKTVSIEDLKDLTIRCAFSVPSGGTEQSIVYAVSNTGSVPRYFQQRVLKQDGVAVNAMDYLCLVMQDGAVCYAGQPGSGNYVQADYSDQFGTADGYFLYNFANLGVGYEKWMKTDGFSKREDATYLNRDCYVYDVKYTDNVFKTQTTAVIHVDKQTGLWLKQEGTISSGESFTRAVESVEENASVIPGSQIVNISEQVIYDDNGIVIAAKKLDCFDPNGTVRLLLETKNNTTSDVKITSHYFDINGLCLGGSVLSYSCAAGETKETELKLPNSSLELSDIEIIQQIEFALKIDNVHTETSPDGSYTVEDGVLVENTGALTIKTDCPSDFVQPVNKEGTVLIDTDEIYLVLCSFEVDMSGSAIFKAYCENKLDAPIRTTIKIKTINGIEYDDFEKLAMQENSEGFAGFWLWSDFLKKNNIQRIESVELTHEVFKGESFVGSERVTEESELIRIDF